MTVKKRLSDLYVEVIKSGKPPKKGNDHGLKIIIKLLEQLQVELGFWHMETLQMLRKLILLFHRLSDRKRIVMTLEQYVIEIISKVSDAFTLYELALFIGAIYKEVGCIKEGRFLLQELRQLIILRDDRSLGLKDTRFKIQFNVTKAVFCFLDVFEQSLGEKGVVLTFSELMADILTESNLFDQYMLATRTDLGIDIVLQYGAQLWTFWEQRKRVDLASVFKARLTTLFINKYGKAISSFHVDIQNMFFACLIVDLGAESSTKIDFVNVVCSTANKEIKKLLKEKKWRPALDLAKCAFAFNEHHGFYMKSSVNVGYAYKLAELMAGIDVNALEDAKMRESFMALSTKILQSALTILRETKIQIISLRFEDLTGLVKLLGHQHNYRELEYILQDLWGSREVQKTWSPETVLSIGRLLVHAYYANGHVDQAIDLCDTIWYNLHRSRGWLDADSIAMSELLSRLYVNAPSHPRYRDAMRVHDEILREIDENNDDDYIGVANKQFELLHAAYQKHGKFESNEKNTYQNIYSSLKRFGKIAAPEPKAWEDKTDKALTDKIAYTAPTEWELKKGAAINGN